MLLIIIYRYLKKQGYEPSYTDEGLPIITIRNTNSTTTHIMSSLTTDEINVAQRPFNTGLFVRILNPADPNFFDDLGTIIKHYQTHSVSW